MTKPTNTKLSTQNSTRVKAQGGVSNVIEDGDDESTDEGKGEGDGNVHADEWNGDDAVDPELLLSSSGPQRWQRQAPNVRVEDSIQRIVSVCAACARWYIKISSTMSADDANSKASFAPDAADVADVADIEPALVLGPAERLGHSLLVACATECWANCGFVEGKRFRVRMQEVRPTKESCANAK